MADSRILLNRPLRGNEPIKTIDDAGVEKLVTSQQIANLAVGQGGEDGVLIGSVAYNQVELSTLAGGITLDLPEVNTIYLITTDGSAGNQNIDIPLPELNVGGFANIDLLNMRLYFLLATQTDGDDVVTFTFGGSPDITEVPSVASAVSLATGVLLNFQYALVSFLWTYSAFSLDGGASQYQFYRSQQPTASVRLGSTATGGNVYISPSPDGGVAYVENLPTEDPLSNGELWDNDGVFSISHGG